MIKRRIAVLTTAALLAGSLPACGVQEQPENSGSSTVQESELPSEDSTTEENTVPEDDIASEESDVQEPDDSEPSGGRRARENLYEGDIELKVRDADVTPNVEFYTVETDLSNIDNLWQFYNISGEEAGKLAENGFAVYGPEGREFFERYEWNRYDQLASFVTVDSLMHTYHLYFAYLMKNVERDHLAERVTQLSRRMLEDSMNEYEKLKGTEWEEAAKRNVAFFTVGVKLLDDKTEVSGYVEDIVGYELDHINRAEGIDTCKITDAFEDYTQYVPRGYYEGDEELEPYFRAMMWYGRVHFEQADEELDRSALLIAKMLTEDVEAYELWESVYDVTSFFAGASDDPGVNEYIQILNEANENGVTTDDLIGDKDLFVRLHRRTGELEPPQINSVPIGDGEDNVILGFRFMGQRFTIDGAIMQRLIYNSTKENSKGDKRMLPDVLDVPAALGSDVALGILEEQGAADYAGYTEHMDELREVLAKENEQLWSASLYSGWMNTLRPLLDVKGEGYPMFMQSEEWTKKDLECFAGSYTELKHDTILYTKQVIAEMGGGHWEQEPDDRGYVQPEPLVYARFADLADRTAYGLHEYGMLTVKAQRDLARLSEMADIMLEISKKELRDETLTEEEYEFIRGYGGSIEHFWLEVASDESGEEYVATQECPAALVADIATNPNGEVLEVATGNPSLIRVIVKVDGKLKIAQGSVYSFYQFPWPMEDRLTDSKWHRMIGIMPNEDGNYEVDKSITKPEWTESYRN